MLKELEFEVTFASNGRTINGKHTFDKGMTTITGPNEAGKSLRLEMIRYALWGVKALRDSLSGYKKLQVRLVIEVAGHDYEVYRHGSTVWIKKDGNDLAAGTKPVNDAVHRIFGYGMDVFDVANACLQGKVDQLTNLKPTERKRMVDRTIGLDAVDDLSKGYSEKVSSLRKAIDTLESSLEAPQPKPEPPECGYSKSAIQLEEELNELRQKLVVKQTMAAELGALACEQPVYKDPYPGLPPLSTLYDAREKQKLSAKELSDLKKRLKTVATPDQNLISAYEDYLDNETYQKWQDYEEYQTQIKQIHSLEAQGSINCQSCGEVNFIQKDRISDINAKIKPVQKPNTPYLGSQSEVKAKLDLEYKKEDEVMQQALIADQIKLLEQADQDNIDYETLIKQANEKEAYINSYKGQEAMFLKYQELRTKYEPTILELDGIEHSVEVVQKLLDGARLYERQMHDWMIRSAMRDRALEQIGNLKKEMELYAKVRQSLNDLKPKVKSYLIPSLAKVSSNLLSQMTNGKRNHIHITDEFEIVVDGDKVETLSGSGQAVANLAVRIGLGTVLTNKIFSVLMVDEIDAYMDANRATYVAQCLKNLNKVFGQIVLVSHKEPEADHYIKLN